MSLGNFLFPGSKATVKSVSIDHKSLETVINLIVYLENSDEPYTQVNYYVHGGAVSIHKYMISNQEDLDALQEDEIALVSMNASLNELRNFSGCFVQKTQGGLVELPGRNVCVLSDLSAAYQKRLATWVSIPVSEATAHETFFSLSALESSDANPVKNAYLYLKTRPEFSACEDI